ncbi:MAG: SDR family NAD(P)-dependent oxidoreductase [Cyanobacteriota bacterium]
MSNVLVIVGMGEGNGMAIARRFGKEGFEIAMMARNLSKLQGYQQTLASEGITSHSFLVDAGDPTSMEAAFSTLKAQLGDPEVLVYNTAVPRMESVLQTEFDTLVDDFRANVAGALVAAQAVLPAMQACNSGTLLFTGGGFALYPLPDFVSLSIGKAGIRVLTNTLHIALKDSPIKVGTITICGTVNGEDPKYSSELIAEEYWKFHRSSDPDYEVVY